MVHCSLGALLLAAPATANADQAPDVVTLAPVGVTAETAHLRGTVQPHKTATAYRFEWGTTTAYGDMTPEHTSSANAEVSANENLEGLQPATTYHVRLVATNSGGTSPGQDVAFTTAARATGPAAALPPLGQLPAAVPGQAGATDQAPAAEDGRSAPAPALGETVVAGVSRGTVLVRLPGERGYASLDGAATLPTGSTIDTRHGAITLVSALDEGGRTQKAKFWGGLFTVRQSAKAGGLTELHLRGTPAGCATRRTTARAAARKRPLPHLWGSDSHGRYRTHGRNSAATVRGTRWRTTETCRGTRTTVKSGAVAVRDRRTRRTVLVRAGHTYLARAKR